MVQKRNQFLIDLGELFVEGKLECTTLRLFRRKVECFLGVNLNSLKISMEIDFHIPYIEKNASVEYSVTFDSVHKEGCLVL